MLIYKHQLKALTLYRLRFKSGSVEGVHFLVILWLIALPGTATDKLPLLHRNHFSVLEEHFYSESPTCPVGPESASCERS